MTGKAFCKNLKFYLEPLLDCPVYVYDQNIARDLPCVMVGVETETQHETLTGNYELKGFIMVATNGYDDEDNSDSDTLSDTVIDLLKQDEFESTMNAPLSGVDSRPAVNFTMDDIYITGIERRDEESSTFVFIDLEIYTANTASI